jgi:hypothetical protein
MAMYAYLPTLTRQECICEMKNFACYLLQNSKVNKISLLGTNNNLTVLNKILQRFNELMRLPLAEIQKNKSYSFIIKMIRDIKFMSYVDTSANIHYIYNEMCLFLEITSINKNINYALQPIKKEIERILAIKE